MKLAFLFLLAAGVAIIFWRQVFSRLSEEEIKKGAEMGQKEQWDSRPLKLVGESQVEPKADLQFWAAWWDEKRTVESLRQAKGISSVSPMWYKLSREGRLAEYKDRARVEIMQLARDKGIRVVPTVSNEFDASRVKKLVNNRQAVEEFGERLVNEARAKGYVGWDIDWEKLDSNDAQAFGQALATWNERLDREGLILTVAVHARTGGADDWEGALGHDYQRLAADEMRIMAYDYHHAESKPGPITPLEWLEKVLQYTLERVPKDKVVLGLPSYGYAWRQGGRGWPVQFEDAERMISENGAKAQRDEISGELWAKFGGSGGKVEVWYIDAAALEKKMKLAKRYGIYRFIFWRLGGEEAGLWERLAK